MGCNCEERRRLLREAAEALAAGKRDVMVAKLAEVRQSTAEDLTAGLQALRRTAGALLRISPR